MGLLQKAEVDVLKPGVFVLFFLFQKLWPRPEDVCLMPNDLGHFHQTKDD